MASCSASLCEHDANGTDGGHRKDFVRHVGVPSCHRDITALVPVLESSPIAHPGDGALLLLAVPTRGRLKIQKFIGSYRAAMVRPAAVCRCDDERKPVLWSGRHVHGVAYGG